MRKRVNALIRDWEKHACRLKGVIKLFFRRRRCRHHRRRCRRRCSKGLP